MYDIIFFARRFELSNIEVEDNAKTVSILTKVAIERAKFRKYYEMQADYYVPLKEQYLMTLEDLLSIKSELKFIETFQSKYTNISTDEKTILRRKVLQVLKSQHFEVKKQIQQIQSDSSSFQSYNSYNPYK